jgi:hypothetical protein
MLTRRINNISFYNDVIHFKNSFVCHLPNVTATIFLPYLIIDRKSTKIIRTSRVGVLLSAISLKIK